MIHGKRRSNLLKTFSKLKAKKPISKGWLIAEIYIEKYFLLFYRVYNPDGIEYNVMGGEHINLYYLLSCHILHTCKRSFKI